MKLEGIPYVTSLLKELNIKESNTRSFSLANLDLGEAIDAKILEFLGDRLLLEYKGEKFYARTNVDLKEQNSIKLIFEGVKEGEVRFRAIPNQNDGSSLNKLELALNEMGVRPTFKNVKIAQQLILQNISVTKSNISFVDKMTPPEVNGTYDEEFELIEHIKVATKLFANKLPITKELVNTIVHSSKEIHIVDNLTVLEEILADKKIVAEKELVNKSSASISATRNQRNVNPLMEFKSEIVPSVSTAKEGFITNDYIQLGMEEVHDKITNLLKDFLLLNNEDDTIGSLQNAVQNTVKNPTLLKMFDILNSISVLEKLDKETVENSINDNIKSNDTIKSEAVTETKTETEKVKESIANMIRGLSKEVLINTDRSNNLDLKDTYLNIPFKIDDQWYPASLHIKREGDRDEKINLDRKVFVSVTVETKNIDRVKVNLDLMQGNISCSILVESHLGYDVFVKSKDELASSLKETFDNVDVKVIKTHMSVDSFEVNSDDKFQGIGRIDFRI